MDRTTKTIYTLLFTSCLSFATANALAQVTHKLGKLTQLEGEISSLSLASGTQREAAPMSKNANLLSGTSYLTNDDGFVTFKIFEHSFLRVGPKTKFSTEYDPKNKILTINLYNGTLKTLFSDNLEKKKLQKVIVKTSHQSFETTNAKFLVSRKSLFEESLVYVEKGVVVTSLNESLSTQYVHGGERTIIKDKQTLIDPPKKITEQEEFWLKKNIYLKAGKELQKKQS